MTDDVVSGAEQDAGNSCRQTWNTSDVRPKERFEYFREGLCQTFLAISPIRPHQGEIAARICHVRVRERRFGQIDTTPHEAHRTSADVVRLSANSSLSINMQLSGGWEVDMDGNTHAMRRGDVTLFRPSDMVRHRMSNEKNFSLFSFLLDDAMQKELPTPRLLEELLILSRQSMSEALVMSMSLLARRLTIAGDRELFLLSSAVASLLCANLANGAYSPAEACDAIPAARQGLTLSIKTFIAENITEPSLSPGVVAMRFGISTRYVHKLFTSDDQTFGAYVLSQRLGRVYADLLDADSVNIAISTIAKRWGLNDMSSFYRNFKLRYEATPACIRASAIKLSASANHRIAP